MRVSPLGTKETKLIQLHYLFINAFFFEVGPTNYYNRHITLYFGVAKFGRYPLKMSCLTFC
jgi:hypothetical protein